MASFLNTITTSTGFVKREKFFLTHSRAILFNLFLAVARLSTERGATKANRGYSS